MKMTRFVLLLVAVMIQGVQCENCTRTNDRSNFCAKPCDPILSKCKGSRDCVCDGDCGFSCVKRGMNCRRPANIDNGRVSGNTTLGSTIRYRCVSPYTLVGAKKRSCRGKGKWDGQEPTCKIICQDPGDIQHGKRKHAGFEPGKKVTYSCSPGFLMQGQTTLTCGETGLWDNDRPKCLCERTNAEAHRLCLPSCQPAASSCRGNRRCVCDGDCGYSCISQALNCGSPPNLAKGRRVFSTTTLGSTVSYRCDKRYTLVGSAVQTCRGTGTWNHDGETAEFECKIICKDPGDIQHGNKNVYGLEKNKKVEYTCFPGYRMEGTRVLTCGSTGQWNGPKPKCIVPSCESPPIPRYAELRSGRIKSSYNFAETVSFRCKTGYFSRGFGIQRCMENGWSDIPLVCFPKSCGHPGNLRNGKILSHVFTFKSKVRFECDYGYKLIGDQYQLCQSNQRWSGRIPTCEPIDCGELPTPSKAEKILNTGTRIDGTVRFECKETGYEINGSEIRTCQSDGTWSGVSTSCEIVSCGDPGTPANGKQSDVKNGYNYGGSVEFTCNTNYTISTSNRIYCEPTKDWNAPIPRCWAPCSDPGVPTNGARTRNDFRHGKSVTFRCPDDFVLKGLNTISCRDGSWSADKPSCKAIKCNDPGAPDHGKQTEVIKNYTYGGSVRFQCVKNYTLKGSAVIKCMKSEKWDNQIPVCRAPCIDPGLPANGARTGNDFRHGKSVAFQCHEDFVLKGEGSIVCKNGRWSAKKPTCKAIKCIDPGKPDHGKQVEVIKNYTYEGSVRFECFKDYTMKGSAVINCMKNEKWDKPIPNCLANCPDPGQPLSGSRIGDDFTHDSVVSFECKDDFFLRGPTVIKCNDGRWSGTTPTCQGCVNGFPLGMKNGRIPDKSILASSSIDAFHAPYYGRLGRDSYWCSKEEKESYLKIQLSKRYKITMISIQAKDKIKGKLELQNEFANNWVTFDVLKAKDSDVQNIALKSRIISQSLKIFVQRIDNRRSVCLRAELYGCNVSPGCIMQGSIVLVNFNGVYKRAYARHISGERLEVILEESPGGRFAVVSRSDVVLDEEPSASELAKGASVLDTSSHTIKEGKLKQKVNSNCQIEAGNLTWESKVEDIRVIKPTKFCA